jgi:hypothetical protein
VVSNEQTNTNNSALSSYRSPTKNPNSFIFDTGTTGHYILMDSNCAIKKTTTHPIQITHPNGAIIQSTHTAHLPFPALPTQALEAHVFPDLKNHALLSIGVFCDAGCTVHFTDTSVQVKLHDKIILEGIRDPPGLWKIQAQPGTNDVAWDCQSIQTRLLGKWTNGHDDDDWSSSTQPSPHCSSEKR